MMAATTRSKRWVRPLRPQVPAATVALVLLGSGCPSNDEGTPAATEANGTTGTTPAASTSRPTSDSTGPATGTTDVNSSEETAAVPPPPFPDFPPPVPRYCGLQDIDRTTDPTTAIDAGEEAGQLPLVVGDALLRNCGCHYTDNVEGLLDYMSDEVPMATHADFHVPFTGVFPQAFDGLVYEAVEQRVVFVDPLPMPPIECDVVGENGMITEADLALFADWLGAGAPDAPNYVQE